MYKINCFGCRGLISEGGVNYSCSLGYPIKTKRVLADLFQPCPTQDCPKPRTRKAMMEIKKSSITPFCDE